jgi:inorganic pyrophosphatase
MGSAPDRRCEPIARARVPAGAQPRPLTTPRGAWFLLRNREVFHRGGPAPMNPYDIESREPDTGFVRVVIDTPAGSRNKYKFDEATGLFRIARVLPVGMAFPHDFGSIPQTCAEDGDPLDALVLGLAPTFPGCLVAVRIMGAIQAVQFEGRKRIRNDRLIGVVQTPVNQPELKHLRDLEPEHLHGIEQFFISYNRAQGRELRFTGRRGPREAMATVRRAEERAKRQ